MNPTSKIHPLRQLITLSKFLWVFSPINWLKISKYSLVISLVLLIIANIHGNIDFIFAALMYFITAFALCTFLAFIDEWKFKANLKPSGK
jgi:hypothetical protein